MAKKIKFSGTTKLTESKRPSKSKGKKTGRKPKSNAWRAYTQASNDPIPF